MGELIDILVFLDDNEGLRVGIDQFDEVMTIDDRCQLVHMAFVVFLLGMEEDAMSGEAFRAIAMESLVVVGGLSVLYRHQPFYCF